MSALMLSETEWQGLVLDYARTYGWWSHHHYDSRRSTAGWPDLVLLRPPELVVVELKTDRGVVSPEQSDVIRMLRASDVEVHVWRPRDESTVKERLSRSRRKAA